MAEQKKYLFGPVPSRRLGRSLGVDIVPFKVCTLDCVYCQLGRTTEKSIERKEYVSIEAVLEELKQRISEGLNADHITISGSGEPTLNSRMGELIDGIKKIADVPVAVITNGTLLNDKGVRAQCAKADVVLPSLDAGDEEVFEKINRPHKKISFKSLVDGLCQFRKEYTGQIWLEVFFVEGVNTDSGQIAKIRETIKKIRPDKIQLNTAVRPTADSGVRKVKAEKLKQIAKELGDNAEVIADFDVSGGSDRHNLINDENVLSMLKRRPCSLDDICSGLEINRNMAVKHITSLEKKKLIISEEKGGKVFYKAC